MADKFLFANNAITTLAAPADAADTSVTVATGSGAMFPSPGAGEQFGFTFVDAATGLITEIAYCTSRTGDVLTLVRGREGTTALDWDAGATVANFWTAGQAANFVQSDPVAAGTTYWVAGGTANALTITPDPALEAYQVGLSYLIKIASNNSTAATLNVSGLGAVAIRDQNDAAIVADALVAGAIMEVVYTAAGHFQLVTLTPISTFVHTLTTKTTPALADEVPIWDVDGAAPKKTTVNAVVGTAAQSDEVFSLAYFLGLIKNG